jgi:hypothetical protein
VTASAAGAPDAAPRDRAKFAKAQSYMVLLDDKASCKNLRCRRPFDISGVKTMAFIQGRRRRYLVTDEHRVRRKAPISTHGLMDHAFLIVRD